MDTSEAPATSNAGDASAALMTSLSMAVDAAVGGGGAASPATFAAKPHEQPLAKKRKFAHTNEAQRRCMLEWLERPGNFQLLASRSGSAAVNGKKIKKTDGFRALMRFVNLHAGSNWSTDITKSRFESFLTSYRKVKLQAQQPQFALTENDRARGITTVAQKLNALCAFFDRIDALHQSTQTAEPLVDQPAVQAGVSGEEAAAESIPTFDTTDASSSGVDTTLEVDTHPNAQDTIEPPVVDESGEMGPTHAPVAAEMPDSTGPESAADTALSPSEGVGMSDEIALKQLAMERERLDLLQEQLAVQKREIELKARALQQQEDDKRRAVRAELAVKLAQSGKSVAEIKELLDLIM